MHKRRLSKLDFLCHRGKLTAKNDNNNAHNIVKINNYVQKQATAKQERQFIFQFLICFIKTNSISFRRKLFV